MNAYRKIGVLAAVTGILALQAGCQQQAKVAEAPGAAPAVEKAEPEPAEGQAKIQFESLVYDFGKVGPGQKLVGEFKLTNAGDAPLKITNVEKCCGAVTKLDKQELAPGESGSLQVQYTSSRMAGAMMKRLYVNSNDKATPRATLTIKAETVLKVAYEPKSLKLMLKEENAACPKITLKSTDNQPFSITSFSATNDALTAEIDSSVQATQFVLQPKADTEKLRKTPTGRITIATAYPQPGAAPETLTILFQALSRFSIRPSMLVFLYDKPEPVKKSLWITNNYGEDFEVESASSKEGRIRVLSQNKVGSRYQFALEITPPEGQIQRFNDTFTVNLKGGETLQVPCRGIFRASTAKRKPAGQ
jgi:hypothetical protein